MKHRMRRGRSAAVRNSVLAVAILLLGAGYWLATGGVPDRPPAVWLTQSDYAHRGQWTDGPARPENSLAAFEEAARNGYAIELDAQLSADGYVVVFHDDDLTRMAGRPDVVSETPLATLKSARLLGGDEHIPTLAEALRRIGGRVPVLVEIKNRGAVGELEDAVARTLAAYEAPVAVISFNPYSLARLAETAPYVPRGQVSAAFRGEDLPFYQKFALRNLLMNWTSRPDFIAYDIQELPWIGTTIQRWRGRPLIGWTAETPAQRAEARGLCDALECSPAALAEGQ